MCGIWGFITTAKQIGSGDRNRFVQSAAVAGTLRGWDSTGVILVPHSADLPCDTVTSLGTGVEFLCSKEGSEALAFDSFHEWRAVIGHNRAATQGAVSLDNAHPFTEGPITLVHNGTLQYTGSLPVSMSTVKKARKDIEVDSHLIAHNLAEHDRIEVLSRLDGAFALVWYDERTRSIYATRNGQRPLHFMKVENEDTVLIASEADMLWWLAGRHRFRRADIFSLDPYVLLEFKPGETTPVITRYQRKPAPTPPPTPWTGKVMGKTQAPVLPLATGAGSTKRMKELIGLRGFDPSEVLEYTPDGFVAIPGRTAVTANGWVWFTPSTGGHAHMQALIYGLSPSMIEHKDAVWRVRVVGVKELPGEKADSEILICRLVGVTHSPNRKRSGQLVKGPEGQVSVAEYLALTTGGCTQCRRSLTVKDAADVVWVNDRTEPLCPTCVTDWINWNGAAEA